MKRNTIEKIALCCTLAFGSIISATARDISGFTLPTPWTEDALEAEVPLAEYPRPQLVREQWQNLNGMWSYMGGKELPSPCEAAEAPVFSKNAQKIRVPFPP